MEIDHYKERTTTLFDTVAVYLAYGKDFLDIKPMTIAVDNDGLTYLDPNGYEVNVAYKWNNLDVFYDHLMDCLMNI